MDGKVLMEARGTTGVLELYADRVRIRREGWTAPLYDRHECSEVRLEQIVWVEIKMKLGGLVGYIVFHDDAGLEKYEDFYVSFMKKQLPAFERVRDAVYAHRDALLRGIGEERLEVLNVEKAVETTMSTAVRM